MYEQGTGVKQDYKIALTYYTKAANLGNLDAVFKLGQLYASSYLVAHNMQKAVEFYKRAADDGQAPISGVSS